MNNENKKKFEKPEMEVIEFTNDDIITDSTFGDPGQTSKDVFHGWW